MKITFISWAQYGYNRRNDLLAQSLSATMHYVYFGKQGNMLQAPVRFLVEARRTWRILLQECPDVIFVHNPPIFNALVAFLFTRRYGGCFVIDSHTGAFISRKWRWSLGLLRMISRDSLAILVHNKHQEKIVKRWRCRFFLLGTYVGEHPQGKSYPLKGKFNVGVVGSIIKKECLDSVFEAANRLPDVSFYVTGHANRISAPLLNKKPENCILTDFLKDEEYLGLLRGVDVILVQTQRDNTVCGGAFEAVALEKPLILSDFPISRDFFNRGTIYIPNTGDGVYQGVCHAQRETNKLEKEMKTLRQQLHIEWEETFKELCNLLQDSILPGKL